MELGIASPIVDHRTKFVQFASNLFRGPNLAFTMAPVLLPPEVRLD
jgi:hypothetical protein